MTNIYINHMQYQSKQCFSVTKTISLDPITKTIKTSDDSPYPNVWGPGFWNSIYRKDYADEDSQICDDVPKSNKQLKKNYLKKKYLYQTRSKNNIDERFYENDDIVRGINFDEYIIGIYNKNKKILKKLDRIDINELIIYLFNNDFEMKINKSVIKCFEKYLKDKHKVFQILEKIRGIDQVMNFLLCDIDLFDAFEFEIWDNYLFIWIKEYSLLDWDIYTNKRFLKSYIILRYEKELRKTIFNKLPREIYKYILSFL